MKILITGGCGFIGSNLSIFLKKKKFNIFSLDNLFRKGSELNEKRLHENKIKNFKIDIYNKNQINRLPKFDLIIDCCAEPSVNASINELDRVINTNLIGTFNILKKCTTDKTKIIFLSSSRVYSLDNLKKLVPKKILNQPINIKKKIDMSFSTFGAKSMYGFSKYASEELIKEFSFIYGLDYIINRCGVVAGPWQFGKVDQGFFSLWMWNHINKRNLNYIGFGGQGHQIRDVLHIDDLCELIFKQIRNIRKIKNKSFSVGGGLINSISLKKLTKICENITKNKIKINSINKTSAYDIPYFVSSNRNVSNTYSWKPKNSLIRIADDIYKWQITNHKSLKHILNK
jgi:CDP-paratose 2-epimerase